MKLRKFRIHRFLRSSPFFKLVISPIISVYRAVFQAQFRREIKTRQGLKSLVHSSSPLKRTKYSRSLHFSRLKLLARKFISGRDTGLTENAARRSQQQTTNNKQQTTKIIFVLLFLTSFLFVQGFVWLFGVGNLPVVAQTPGAVTIASGTAQSAIAQSTTSPESLVQEARRLYRAGQFSEALTRLQQAVEAFAAKKDSVGQATALDLQGQVYLTQEKPQAAAESFSAAVAAYERGRDETGAIKSRINQAQALRNNGQQRRALDTLEQVNDSLKDQPNSSLKAIALRSLGITQRLIGDLGKAQKAVEESLKIAESLPDPDAREHISAARLMLGNIAKDRRNVAAEKSDTRIAERYFQDAIAQYRTAAETATTPTAKIEAQLNELSVVGDTGQPFTDEDRELLRQIRATIDQLPLSRTTVYARINWARMAMEPKNQANVNPQDIAQQLLVAREQARQLQDPRGESYALGQLGELRKLQGQLKQAEENTKQALIIAQSIGATDVAYRWQWQLGQILKAEGKTEGAIAAYDAAVNNLDSIRGDLVSVNRDVQFSFRDSVEPVYRELVGLLLKSEDSKPENLEKARQIIESLQQAELVNFFRENCLTAKPIQIDEIDQKAAVVYPIVLPDGLEVVVSFPNSNAPSGVGLRHESMAVTQAEMEETFAQLREAIAPVSVDPNRTAPDAPNRPATDEPNPTAPDDQNSTALDDPNRASIALVGNNQPGDPERYLPLAQKLYDWIIRPVERDIASSGVKTLVFVLDTPLLNIPMAALYDGKEYLIQKYAIAQTPGLQLLDPKPLERGELTVLKGGLSAKRELELETGESKEIIVFPELPNVQIELEKLTDELNIPGAFIFNEKFTTDAIKDAINSVPFPVVHLATHGQFGSNPEDTFLLTWNGKLSINELNELLQGREAGGTNAIELLVLSACETATGDRRAALGLAGVAVKAGARSTLATLWQVDDQSTAELMIEFYRQLKQDRTISKAEALRRAQVSFIQRSDNFRKPYYWAPFVLVGNWL